MFEQLRARLALALVGLGSRVGGRRIVVVHNAHIHGSLGVPPCDGALITYNTIDTGNVGDTGVAVAGVAIDAPHDFALRA
jgi:hypothetical protein